MRLIDIDKISKDAEWDEYYDGFMSYSSAMIDEAEIVDAIPIYWLHYIMEKQLIFAMESEMEGTTTVKDGVIHCISGAVACQVLANVIKLWEKENESRDTESTK